MLVAFLKPPDYDGMRKGQAELHVDDLAPSATRHRVMVQLKCSARGTDGAMETCFHREA